MTSPIATLAEPHKYEGQSALVVLIYWAREWLSDIERGCNANERHLLAARAAAYLQAAYHLAIQDNDNSIDASMTKFRLQLATDLQRAREASEALVHNVSVFLSYAKDLDARIDGRSASDFHSGVTRSAAKYAKQETHRALTSALDLFPTAFRKED